MLGRNPAAPAARLGRVWQTPPALEAVDVAGLVLFALLGFALGYAVPGWPAWLALLVPVVFAILTVLLKGFSVTTLIILVVSLAIIAATIIAGRAVDARQAKRREEAA